MTILIPKVGHRKTVRNVNTTNPYIWADFDVHVSDIRTQQVSALRTSPRGRWRPPLPYSIVIEEGDVRVCSIDGKYIQWNGSGVDETTLTGAVADTTYFTPIPPRPARLINYAETKALTRLKAQDVNYAQALGERAQTARLLGDTCRRLAKLAKACHDMDLVEAISTLNVGGNHRKPRRRRRNRTSPTTPFELWLELQYGWKPLLSDFYGTLDAFALGEMRRERLKAHVTGKSMSSEDFSETKTLVDSVGNYINVTKHCRVNRKVFCRLDYVKNDDVPLAGNLSQMGISNPLMLAWELLPWSFVADWFVPIGAYLNTLDATFGWSFLGGSLSMKDEMHTTLIAAESVSSYPPWPTSGDLHPVGSKSRQLAFERVTYADSPTPDFPMYIKDNPSVDHALNGISLLATAIAGKSRVR